MKEQLMKLPKAIQKQIMIKLVGGVLFLFLFIIILACFGDLYFCLPCLLLSGFLFVNGGRLFYNGANGNYICIGGICETIEKSGIRKRIRSISLTFEQNRIRIPIWQRMKTLSVGDTVIVYVSDKTPVYEQEEGYVICSYYALETKKESGQNGNR